MSDQQPTFQSSLDRVRGTHPLWQAIGLVGSVWMAATLITVIGVVTWVATYYEAAFGREATTILVYQSWWFNGIFLVLAAAVIAAVVVRWPLKRHQYGFAVVHLGLLLIIAGFAVAGRDRLDGMLLSAPGREATQVDLPVDYVAAVSGDQSQAVHVQTYDLAGFPSFARFLFHPFVAAQRPDVHVLPEPAPILNLPDGTTVSITRTAFTARHEAGRVLSPDGDPAVRVGLWVTTPGQSRPSEMGGRWLTDDPEGGLLALGPLSATFARTRSPGFVAEFLTPLAGDMPPDGVLHVFWHDHAWAFPVTTLPAIYRVSDALTVTIVEAIANPTAMADGSGLEHDPKAARNPVLKVVFSAPDQGQERTTTAWVSVFSLLPSLPGDWPELLYSHPALAAAEGPGKSQGGWAQLLAGPDDRLHVRCGTRSRGLGPHDSIEPGATWRKTLVGGAGAPMALDLDLRWLPHSLPGPEPVQMQAAQQDKAARWIEFLVKHGGAEQRQWLMRGMRQAVSVGGVEVLLHYDQGRLDLKRDRGFAVRLERFEEGRDPGGMRSASYASEVTIVATDGERRARISMNEPLQQGSITLYQTAFSPEIGPDGLPTGRQMSIFTVAEDHGRWIKYLGSAVLVAGILLLYFLRGRRTATTPVGSPA